MIVDLERRWQTVRMLHPGQVMHRIRLRLRRRLYGLAPSYFAEHWDSGPSRPAGWPTEFRPTDLHIEHPTIEHQASGARIYRLLGEQHSPTVDGWRPTDRSHLYRFHLNYFEWAWPLVAAAETGGRSTFEELWASWDAEQVPGRCDEWSPYVVSLRAWVLCGIFDDLVVGTPIEGSVLRHQRQSLRFLSSNLELDVGGNHLLKNLKALVGLSIWLGDDATLQTALRHLRREVDIQILDDGGHFELSPGYHVQVMNDLVDVFDLCRAAGITTGIDDVALIDSMGNWLQSIVAPDGTLPLLGDTTPPPPGALTACPQEVPITGEATILADSGYVVLQTPRVHLVADFGDPCPPTLPAHAQADWGTFELWIDGEKVVTDPGVSTYVGPVRARERSTAAHNTVTINEANQTDVWGSFRAGRRAQPGPVSCSRSAEAISVSATNVDIAGIEHQRTFEIMGDTLSVFDTVTNDAPGISRLLLANGTHEWRVVASGPHRSKAAMRAAGFGVLVPGLQIQQDVVDQRSTWRIDLGPARS